MPPTGTSRAPYLIIRSVEVAARRDSESFVARRLHLVYDPEVEIELWAQDIGEPVLVDGKERFLVARKMPPGMGPRSKMSEDRQRVAEIVFGGESVIEAPFVFEGGNVAFDRGLVLIGGNDVSRTIAASGERRSRREVLDDVAAAFGATDAVEMGEEPPSPLLQHIDQAFVLLEGRAAVACRLKAADSIPKRDSFATIRASSRTSAIGFLSSITRRRTFRPIAPPSTSCLSSTGKRDGREFSCRYSRAR